MKRTIALFSALLSLALLLALAACSSGPEAGKTDWRTKDFAEVEQAARGTTVRWYMYGGWEHVNRWVDNYVAGELKKRYDITLVRVPMDAPEFVNKLLTEKSADKDVGVIDLLWINGENFRNARQADALWGPYADRLPNYGKYVDKKLATRDFGFPVDGYETPYGQAQFVYEYDTARTVEPPATFEALLAWVKEHPGRFTYPQPPDFTGSAFIRQAFYALTGGHQQYMKGFDQQLFDANAPKLWAYLNEMKPFLWEAGRSYPQSSAALDTLFARGEVDLDMSYHPLHAQSKILEGAYPKTVRSYPFRDGSLFNLHFVAIPFNAPNKPGAMVAANFILSPECQLSKLEPSNWGDYPGIDVGKLPPDMREAFDAVDLGEASMSPAKLAPYAVPEIPADYLEALEAGWEAHVLH